MRLSVGSRVRSKLEPDLGVGEVTAERYYVLTASDEGQGVDVHWPGGSDGRCVWSEETRHETGANLERA